MDNSLAIYLFHQGTNYSAYTFLGSHFDRKNKQLGVMFRVFAPNAVAVSVVGDFNNWDDSANYMQRLNENGIYECFIEGVNQFDCYKYCIITKDNRKLYKADPYAFHSTLDKDKASKVYKHSNFKWTDSEFTRERKSSRDTTNPINIYEVNLASWKRKENGDYLTYREYAIDLCQYVKRMGYTHVELMPITEYPFDGSWGYQVTGYFQVSSRFGTPDDFKFMVNYFHKNNIGIILDWVPAHFPKDDFGLFEFDGSPLYENQGWDRQEHKAWGTRIFDLGRTEVQSFLVSSARYFIKEFHIDGLRVDAVASMLYLDYDRKPGEWIPNIHGDNKNLEAIAFFKKLNTVIHEEFDYCMMIAEESTSYAMVTKEVKDGGLGFDYKWNMGWMNDILSYIKEDPIYRKYHHGKLTFSLMYAFDENFILPISHDEVVHGKGSLINKQFGSYEDKFSALRLFIGLMYSHPGKKLMFMGQEFGQFKEWNYREGLEFFLLDYDIHAKTQLFFKEMNNFYKSTECFYQDQLHWSGFEWLSVDEADKNIIAFKRKTKYESVVCIFNFSGDFTEIKLGLDIGSYSIIFSSDKQKYGGSGLITKRVYKTTPVPSHGKAQSIQISLPKYSFVYLKNNLQMKQT